MLRTALTLLACCGFFLFAQEVKGQPALEKEIVSEINKVRRDPVAYANWMEKNIAALPLGSMVVKPATVREAIAVLKKTSPLPELTYASGMYQAAADHVKDQLAKGVPFSHMGTDGTNPLVRMKRYGVFKSPGYENGSVMRASTAESVVLQWVVDELSLERLHREAVLNPKVLFVAAACGVYKASGKVVGETLCVACFAGGYQNNPKTVRTR